MEAAQKALRKNGLVAVQSEQPVPKGKGKRKASEGDAAGSGASSSTGGHASAKPEDAEASSSACGAPAKRLRTKQAPAEPVCIGEAAPSAHALANDAPEALLEQDLNPEGLSEPVSKKDRAAQKRKRDALAALEFLEAANLPGLHLPEKQHFSKCSFTLTAPASRADATSIGCVLYNRAFFVKKPTSPSTWTPGARILLGKAGAGMCVNGLVVRGHGMT